MLYMQKKKKRVVIKKFLIFVTFITYRMSNTGYKKANMRDFE